MSDDDLPPETLVSFWRDMLRIRAFEQAALYQSSIGKVYGALHSYEGQESCAVGICSALRDGDYAASTHRGHGHCLAMGARMDRMMAELFGRIDGYCKGKGGSLHIADLGAGMLGANGIVGGAPPLVCGGGLSAKVRGTSQVGIAFVGDGGSNQGTFLESLNLAAVWHLPVVFVVENNGYAETTSTKFHQSGIDVAKRADGFGLPGVVVDGHDFFAVHEVAGEAIRRARDGGGPSLLECKVARYYGHFEGDSQTYRGPGEVETIRAARDCLDQFGARVTAAGLVDRAELAAIDTEARALVDDAVREAKAAGDPDQADLLTDVYVSY